MAQNYFDLFGNITLDEVQIIDIFKQISFKESLPDSKDLFNYINLIDGDTPDSIAERFYGTKNHYWIILLSNKIKDYFTDWPMKDIEIKKYVKKRVAALRAELNSDQEFMDLYASYGQTGDSYTTIYNAMSDAMYVDLTAINDGKRQMKYLKPRFLDEFLSAVTERT